MKRTPEKASFWESFGVWTFMFLVIAAGGAWFGPVVGGIGAGVVIVIALIWSARASEKREREQRLRDEAAADERERDEAAAELAVRRALNSRGRTHVEDTRQSMH